MSMRRTRLLAAAGALALALAIVAVIAFAGENAEDGGDAAERASLLLDYFPNPDHAGIYAAQARGRFREAGIDVRVRAPADPAEPLKRVAAGRTDLAISYEPEVLRARDRGLPVVSVASLVHAPLTSIVSLPRAGIRTPADLRGKTIGTAGIDYQGAYLDAILERAGVPRDSVRVRDVGFDLSPALLAGRVDAVLGAFWNVEAVDLRLRGRDPRVIRMEQAGVPRYDELVIVANERTVRERPELVRRFLRGLAAGTDDLRRDPESGVRALVKANPELDERLQRESVRVTLPLFLPPPGRPFGWHDPAAWGAFASFMRENRILRGDAAGAFTNSLLPE